MPAPRPAARSPRPAPACRPRRSRNGRARPPRRELGQLQRGPPSTQAARAAGQGDVALARPSAAPTRAAFADHHQIGSPPRGRRSCWPRSGGAAARRGRSRSGASAYGASVIAAGSRKRGRIDRELDDDRLADEPQRPELVAQRRPPRRGRRAAPAPSRTRGAVRPRLRRRGALGDDHAAPERGGNAGAGLNAAARGRSARGRARSEPVPVSAATTPAAARGRAPDCTSRRSASTAKAMSGDAARLREGAITTTISPLTSARK